MDNSQLITLVQFSAALLLTFGIIYVSGKSVDKANPEDAKYRPTRLTEIIAPYVMAVCILGIVLGCGGLFIDWLKN